MHIILIDSQYHAAKLLVATAITLVERRNRDQVLSTNQVGVTMTLGDASVSLSRDPAGALYKAQVEIRGLAGDVEPRSWTVFASGWDSAALTALQDCEYALDGRNLGLSTVRPA